MSADDLKGSSGPYTDPRITPVDQPDTMQKDTPRETSAGSSARASPTLRNDPSRKRRFRWLSRLGAGIVNDVRSRLPWYKSDWADAWNYRVVPATALIFFAKCVRLTVIFSIATFLSLDHSVLPGIAFSLDLIETTQQYGVAEVLISSFMAAFIFSVFGAQPLTIGLSPSPPLPQK